MFFSLIYQICYYAFHIFSYINPIVSTHRTLCLTSSLTDLEKRVSARRDALRDARLCCTPSVDIIALRVTIPPLYNTQGQNYVRVTLVFFVFPITNHFKQVINSFIYILPHRNWKPYVFTFIWKILFIVLFVCFGRV